MSQANNGYEKYYNERLATARRGEVKAIYDLGLFHCAGSDDTLSYVEAYKYFHLAASRGLKRAEVDCKEIECHLSKADILKAVKLSTLWR